MNLLLYELSMQENNCAVINVSYVDFMKTLHVQMRSSMNVPKNCECNN